MKYDVGIILSHFHTWFGFTSRQKKRMDKGIELLRKGKVRFLMTTGGKGVFNPTARPVGEWAKDYLVRNGVNERNILVENKSTSTEQNAKFALEIMRKNSLHSAIVITSADNMSRAQRIFKNVFPKNYNLDFVVSDYFSGFWSVWDFFWHAGGWVKYAVDSLQRKR